MEYNGSLIIVDWLACLYCLKSGWRCIGRFPPALALDLHNPSANGKQGPIPVPEEIFQTLLTIKK
jgi:hypothetical protein